MLYNTKAIAAKIPLTTILRRYNITTDTISHQSTTKSIKCPIHQDSGDKMVIDFKSNSWTCKQITTAASPLDLIALVENISSYEAAVRHQQNST